MKILIVGAGSIGKRHISNLIKLDRDLNMFVVEPSEDVRDFVNSHYGLLAYPSLEEALQKNRFDAALICSPNHLHISQAKLLAEVGCHLFIEKPISLNRDEALSLAPCVEKAEVMLMVGCNLRFHPAVVILAEVLRSEKIGRPLYARAQFAHYLPNWRAGQDYRSTYSARKDHGGGILLDDIHEPDYLCWLLGDVTHVSGSLSKIGNLDVDVEDVADYLMWHDDRLYSHVHADYLRRDKTRSCELIGTQGSVVWHSKNKNPEWIEVKLFDAMTGNWETLYKEEEYDLNIQYIDEMEYFLECIEDNREPMNGLNHAVRLIEVLDCVREASKCGKKVNITRDEK